MSETDPIAAYQEAIAAFTTAEQKAERMAKNVNVIGNRLANWKEVMFSNLSVGFPAHIAFSKTPGINADDWPTALQMAEAIAAYHTAKLDLSNAWNRVPEGRRVGLQPPPR